jgi:hypothetical protein
LRLGNVLELTGVWEHRHPGQHAPLDLLAVGGLRSIVAHAARVYQHGSTRLLMGSDVYARRILFPLVKFVQSRYDGVFTAVPLLTYPDSCSAWCVSRSHIVGRIKDGIE